MIKLNSMIRKSLLAVALAGAAFGASAAPTTYHVNVNTTSVTGGTYLEFGFSGSAPAVSTTATVANLGGAALTFDSADGATVNGAGNGFVISNGNYNYVDYIGAIASMFSFDVTFSDGYLADTGFESAFSLSILDSGLAPVSQEFALFTLSAANGIVIEFAQGFGDATLVNASDVPEPTQLALMLTALALMGLMVKRRQA